MTTEWRRGRGGSGNDGALGTRCRCANPRRVLGLRSLVLFSSRLRMGTLQGWAVVVQRDLPKVWEKCRLSCGLLSAHAAEDFLPPMPEDVCMPLSHPRHGAQMADNICPPVEFQGHRKSLGLLREPIVIFLIRGGRDTYREHPDAGCNVAVECPAQLPRCALSSSSAVLARSTCE